MTDYPKFNIKMIKNDTFSPLNFSYYFVRYQLLVPEEDEEYEEDDDDDADEDDLDGTPLG